MEVYNYDPNTNEFIDASLAKVDVRASQRLGEEVYLLPANATFEKPPTVSKGFVAVFVNGAWDVVEDNRKTIIYDKENPAQSILVNFLGPISKGFTTQKPDCPFPMWDEANNKWIVNEEKRQIREQEKLIQEEMRKQAIAKLVKDKKLPKGYE